MEVCESRASERFHIAHGRCCATKAIELVVLLETPLAHIMSLMAFSVHTLTLSGRLPQTMAFTVDAAVLQ